MLLNEKQFQSQYGQLYNEALAEARTFVDDHGSLKIDIKNRLRQIDTSVLHAPQPDQFAYRLMQYRGFLRFPGRLKNYIVAQHETRAAVRSYLPYILDVEPTNRCNFKCNMCVRPVWKKSSRTPDMDADTYKAFIRRNESNLMEVKLQGIGEPLLHPHFFDMIRFTVERDIWLRSTVNGSLLHINDNYRKLIDSGIGEVQLSFDGATADVFSAIRKGADFDRIVENLTMLNSYADTKGQLYTRMWVLVQKLNRHQIFQFVELARRMKFKRLTFSINLGDWADKSVEQTNNQLQADFFSPKEEEQLVQLSQNGDIEITVWGTNSKYSAASPDTLCPVPFTRGFVGAGFRIAPCGGIGDPGILDLGDAVNLKKSWNDEPYKKFRQAHLDGKLPAPCRICYRFGRT